MENETSDAKVPIIERHKEIDLIQSCINRMAQNSFQVKGWTVALFAVILALLPEKVESTNKFFLGVVMLAVSVMFWYLDSFFLADFCFQLVRPLFVFYFLLETGGE